MYKERITKILGLAILTTLLSSSFSALGNK